MNCGGIVILASCLMGRRICRAAFADKTLAVYTLTHLRVGLMRADRHTAEGAVILGLAVIFTLAYSAAYAMICVHGIFLRSFYYRRRVYKKYIARSDYYCPLLRFNSHLL